MCRMLIRFKEVSTGTYRRGTGDRKGLVCLGDGGGGGYLEVSAETFVRRILNDRYSEREGDLTFKILPSPV